MTDLVARKRVMCVKQDCKQSVRKRTIRRLKQYIMQVTLTKLVHLFKALKFKAREELEMSLILSNLQMVVMQSKCLFVAFSCGTIKLRH